LTCSLNADKISITRIKKLKKRNDENSMSYLCPEMVVKIREIHPKKWGRLQWEGKR